MGDATKGVCFSSSSSSAFAPWSNNAPSCALASMAKYRSLRAKEQIFMFFTARKVPRALVARSGWTRRTISRWISLRAVTARHSPKLPLRATRRTSSPTSRHCTVYSWWLPYSRMGKVHEKVASDPDQSWSDVVLIAKNIQHTEAISWTIRYRGTLMWDLCSLAGNLASMVPATINHLMTQYTTPTSISSPRSSFWRWLDFTLTTPVHSSNVSFSWRTRLVENFCFMLPFPVHTRVAWMSWLPVKCAGCQQETSEKDKDRFCFPIYVW